MKDPLRDAAVLILAILCVVAITHPPGIVPVAIAGILAIAAIAIFGHPGNTGHRGG